MIQKNIIISVHLKFCHCVYVRARKYSTGKGSFAYQASMYPVSHQSASAKLVGVVVATVESVSLQQKSVSQSSPTTKANRSYPLLGRQLQASICNDVYKEWGSLCSPYSLLTATIGYIVVVLAPNSLECHCANCCCS